MAPVPELVEGCLPATAVDWQLVLAAGAVSFSVSVAAQVAASWQQRHQPIRLGTAKVEERPLPPDTVSCKSCKGSRKVTCPTCDGMGRINLRDVWVLPKGVTPVRCSTCHAAGLVTCARCLGTGIKPPTIGFRI